MTTPTVLHHKIIEMIKYENTCQCPDRYQLDVALSRDGQPDSLLSWTTLSFDSAGSRKRSALIQRGPGNAQLYSAVFWTVIQCSPGQPQYDSPLSWTALSFPQHCPGQCSNAVSDSCQLDSALSRTVFSFELTLSQRELSLTQRGLGQRSDGLSTV